MEDSGLGSASERTAWSEERDQPLLSVKERAKRLDVRFFIHLFLIIFVKLNSLTLLLHTNNERL